MDSFKPDIVHIHNLHFAASASVLYAIKSKKVPFVITLLNFRLLCPSGTLYFNGKPYLKSLSGNFPWAAIKDGVYVNSKILTFWVAFSTWINRMIGTWKMADRYIVLTGHAKNIIAKSNLHLDEDKIIIKPNFVYDISAGTDNRNKNFLFVGRLSEEKGIHVLLDAFKHSSNSLTIFGDGPLRDLVEEVIKDNPNIIYLGFQSKDVLTSELKKCSALIFPSVWYETFGLTIIEAFAASTPVIASNIGSASLLIKDGFNGLHFEQSNADDLRAKIEKWQSLSETQKNVYRKNARTTYEEYYTPEENLKQLLSVYTSIIDEKKELISLEINIARYREFIERNTGLALSGKSHYACFANVHMLIEAHLDPAFAEVINNADVVTPDGKALCWDMHLLYGINQERVAGMDVLPDMLQQAEEKKLSVFFYGSS